ncbi:hypothetical protein L0F63_006973 [Massospora cicadina]|nr:hypothetical protein L0F63_006973 [Massospora cicadina]
MEELLNDHLSDGIWDGEASFEDVHPPPPQPSARQGGYGVASNDSSWQDGYGVASNHSSLSYTGKPYPTYTPLPLSVSHGAVGLARLRIPAKFAVPKFGLELRRRHSEPPYTFKRLGTTVRIFPPVREVGDKLYRQTRNHFSSARRLQRQLGEPVPLDLLAGLSAESDAETGLSNIYDPLQGNRLCLTRSGAAPYLVYATGTLSNQLQYQKLGAAWGFKYSPSLTFSTPIQQLVSCDSLLGVRLFSGVALVGAPFELRGELSLPNTPTDFTFHPTLNRLTASVTTSQDTYLWNLGDERPELIGCPFSKDPSLDHFMANLGCIRFGPHPRSLVLGTTEELCVVDARTFAAKAQSVEAGGLDRFWGFDIDPTNPFQLGVSGSDALVLYDLRYLQRPALDWRHVARSLPRPHVKFVGADALLGTACVVAWGSRQGLTIYPLDHRGLASDPFQFPLPGEKRAPYSFGQVVPQSMAGPATLHPFGFLEDPGAPSQVGAILRPLESHPRDPLGEGAIELFQLLEDGAVYCQRFCRVPFAGEPPGFDCLEDACSSELKASVESSFKGKAKATLRHSFVSAVEAWLTPDVALTSPHEAGGARPWVDLLRPSGYLASPTFEVWRDRLGSTLDSLRDGSVEVLANDLSEICPPQTQLTPELGATATRILEGWVDIATPPTPPVPQAPQKLPPNLMPSHLSQPIPSAQRPLPRLPLTQLNKSSLGGRPKARRPGFF